MALLGLAEGAARAFLTSPSAQQFDPDLGWRWRPGVTAANYSEGGAPFVANALGFNDDEVGEKTRYRIVAYGNSFTEAIQVPRAENYTSRLEGLCACDVVNLGRSAMGPPHYPIVADKVGRALAPDLSLVHLGEGDLLFMVNPSVHAETGPDGQLRAITVPVLEKDRLKARFGFLLDRSALATYLMRRLKPVVGAWLDMGGPPPAPARAPTDAERDAQRALAYARLVFVLRALTATGPVLVLDTPMLRYTATSAEIATPWEGEAFARAAAEAGAQFVDAGPALIREYEASGQPPYGFQNLRPGQGHLNARGHAVVAQVLADHLARTRR